MERPVILVDERRSPVPEVAVMAVLIRITLCLSLILCRLPTLSAGTDAPFTAQTFEDWVPIQGRDGNTYYARRADFASPFDAAKAGTASEIRRVPLYTFSFGDAVKNEPVANLSVAAAKASYELKIYPKPVGGTPPMALCPPGAACDGSDSKTPDISASVCRDEPSRCDSGRVSVRWPRTQALTVSAAGTDGAVLGDPDKTLERMPARDRWLLGAVRAAPDGDKVFARLMLQWSKDGKADSGALTRLFQEEGAYQFMTDPDPDHPQISVKMKGEGDEAKPDFLASLNPLERSYLDTMMPPAARGAFLKVAASKNLDEETTKRLIGALRGQTQTALSGGTVASPKEQLAYLQKTFGKTHGLDDDSVAALMRTMDGASDANALDKKGAAGNLVVAGDGKDKDDPTGLPTSDFKPKVPKIDQGRVSDIAPEKKLGELKKEPSTLAEKALGFAKNKWMMGGAGAVLGGLLGFMLLGPMGAAMGVMAGGMMGAMGSQVVVNKTGPPAES